MMSERGKRNRVSSLSGYSPKSKAQVAMEYMITMGFVLAALSALIVVYYVYTQGSTEELTASQLSKIAKDVVDSAEEVYYLGKPSQVSMRVYIPERLESATVSGKQLVLVMRTDQGPAEIVESSAVNISGGFPLNEGVYLLTVKAADGYANVSYR
jgi:hypothetical protein